MDEYGVVTEPGTLRLERVLPGPIERVWAYLTESDKRAKWLASGPLELRMGGKGKLKFKNSGLSEIHEPTPDRYRNQEDTALAVRVTHCEPPRLLSYTWGDKAGDSDVTFELTPRGSDVFIVLTHRGLGDRAEMLSVAGGWHTHLGILIDRLNSRPSPGFWSTHARLEKEYEKRIPATMSVDTKPHVQVRVTRRFSATPERVFDAWLDIAMIGRWMFGPALRDEEILHLNVDARVGGKFSFLVRRDGKELDHVGEYLEIDRPRRLVFTWLIAGTGSSEVSIDIVALDRGCDFTLLHELHPDWADYADRTKAGWTKMTGVLAGLLG